MSGQVVQLNQQGNQESGVVTGLRPLIPPGTYKLAYIEHYTMMFCKAPKVVLRFRVVDMGGCFGVELERFYNVQRLIGKPGKKGRFKVGASSDLVFEFCQVCSDRIDRLDRLPLSLMNNFVTLGDVHTVERNRKQKNLPELLKYSVIKELTGIDT